MIARMLLRRWLFPFSITPGYYADLAAGSITPLILPR